ncbi:MAG: Caudovirus prohead serine protease [Cyanobacteriota bacterium]
MATPETLERREVLRLQSLATAPSTANEQARTVELGIATEADVGGLVLSCRADAVSTAAVVNVLLDHRNETSAIAGRLLSIRAEKGQLIGLAEFSDAPAAETGWQLAKRGCPTSVRAQFSPDDIEPGRNGAPDRVRRWRLAEVSLVAIGADLTTTRSAAPAAIQEHINALEGDTMTASPIKPETTEHGADGITASAAELRRADQLERELLKLCDAVPAASEAIRGAATSGGLQAARDAAIAAMAEHQRRTQPQTLGSITEAKGSISRRADLEDALLRRLKGDGSAVTTLQLLETITGRRGRADEL